MDTVHAVSKSGDESISGNLADALSAARVVVKQDARGSLDANAAVYIAGQCIHLIHSQIRVLLLQSFADCGGRCGRIIERIESSKGTKRVNALGGVTRAATHDDEVSRNRVQHDSFTNDLVRSDLDPSSLYSNSSGETAATSSNAYACTNEPQTGEAGTHTGHRGHTGTGKNTPVHRGEPGHKYGLVALLKAARYPRE